jgi:hypothetical protein
VHELDALDAEVLEVCVQLRALVFDHFVADDAHTAAQRQLHVGQQAVRGFDHVVGDFDGGGQSGGHHSLDCLRVKRRQRQTVALALDASWVDCVRVD